jgi:3-hydroxyacyl-CoA dehydrogenase (EC 1.1.1.35)
MSDIKTIGVVGCGTMGTGIAIVAARAGLNYGSSTPVIKPLRKPGLKPKRF